MKAVILAAGIGSRLKKLTGDKPKCLVNVNGRCMIDYQLDALLAGGVHKVYIVAGFQADRLIEHVGERFPADNRIEFVVNPDFATTNNMYSLSLCASRVRGEAFLLMNADVVFDASIIRDLTSGEGGAICVDVGAYNDESMKVVQADGRLVAISKTVPQADALGSSIDVYRLGSAESEIVFAHVLDVVGRQGRRNDWTEVALHQLMSDGRLRMEAFDIRGRHWYEIDNLDDLRQAEMIFGRTALVWDRIRMAFVDMDGTLFKGAQPFPGAPAFFAELRERVPHVYCLSNNSSRSHDEYVTKLHGLGIDVREDEILLSTDALTSFLCASNIRKVYVVGTESLRRVLRQRGIEHDEEAPQAVVLGYDTELTYAKLRAAALMLHAGLPYFATHVDVVCPTEQGGIPDIGAMSALLEATTGRQPDRTFGKPNADMVRFLYERHGVAPSESVFIGDRVYTDHAMARQCGAQFIGVLSGEATRADYEGLQSIVIFPSVAEIFDQGVRPVGPGYVAPVAVPRPVPRS